MNDFTDDYESDDFSDDFDDDDFEDPLGIDEDDEYCDEDEAVSEDDFNDDGAVPDADSGGDDFDLKLEDATPIGGISVKKAVIFGVAMEWEDEEGLGKRKKRKDVKRERDGN